VISSVLVVLSICGSLVLLIVGVFVSLVLLAVRDLISEELRGWLERAPAAVLRLAAARLSADQRQARYEDEWMPELLFILRKAEGRPITRLILSLRYSLGMLRSAGTVARNLPRVRGAEGKPSQADIPPDPPPGHLAREMAARQPAPSVTVTGFTGVAALSGTGTLAAGAVLNIPGAAALSGSGSLTAHGVVISAAALSGSGSLTARSVAGIPAG
jgi:hypothetical protein